jgi:hypothetical protein
MMSSWKLTRRAFLSLSASMGLLTISGWGCSRILNRGTTAYRRTGKGRHVSNAAKKHNANHLYANKRVAAQDIAHPGDRSKVVKITISRAMHRKLFPVGKLVADLRHDL